MAKEQTGRLYTCTKPILPSSLEATRFLGQHFRPNLRQMSFLLAHIRKDLNVPRSSHPFRFTPLTLTPTKSVVEPVPCSLHHVFSRSLPEKFDQVRHLSSQPTVRLAHHQMENCPFERARLEISSCHRSVYLLHSLVHPSGSRLSHRLTPPPSTHREQ